MKNKVKKTEVFSRDGDFYSLDEFIERFAEEVRPAWKCVKCGNMFQEKKDAEACDHQPFED